RRFDLRGSARHAHCRRHRCAHVVDAVDGEPPSRRRSSMARLTLEHVTKSFGAFRALDHVSLEVADGEFMAILGASGCGKTTLLRQVAGFDKLYAGRILIGDSVVSALHRHVP